MDWGFAVLSLLLVIFVAPRLAQIHHMQTREYLANDGSDESQAALEASLRSRVRRYRIIWTCGAILVLWAQWLER